VVVLVVAAALLVLAAAVLLLLRIFFRYDFFSDQTCKKTQQEELLGMGNDTSTALSSASISDKEKQKAANDLQTGTVDFKSLPAHLRDDVDLCCIAVRKSHENVKHAGAKLRTNVALMHKVLLQAPTCYAHCAEEVRSNHGIIRMMLQDMPVALCKNIPVRVFLEPCSGDQRKANDNNSSSSAEEPQQQKQLIFGEELIRIYPPLLRDAPESMRANKAIVLEAVRRNGMLLECASEDLAMDQEIVVAAILRRPAAIQFSPLRNDKHFLMSKAIYINAETVNFAAVKLKTDREIALLAVSKNGLALQYLVEYFESDLDVNMRAVMNNGLALEYVRGNLKNSKTISMEAVHQNGHALRYCNLKNDKDICLEAVKSKGFALEFCSNFKNDREIVIAAVRQDKYAIKYASQELANDSFVLLVTQWTKLLTQQAKLYSYVTKQMKCDCCIITV